MDEHITLQTIFGVTHDDATTHILEAVDKQVWKDLGIPQWLWKTAAGKVASKLDGLLGVPLPDVICGAFNTYREFHAYTDETKYPPGKEFTFERGEFSVESEHVPTVKLVVSGFSPRELKFPITLGLTFTGARIFIRDKRFRFMKPGACTASGRLCCEKIEILKRDSSPLELPGMIRFGDGILIT